MTNTLAVAVITATLATNWTGFKVGDKELGYVSTNYVAEIEHGGKTHKLELKSVPSDIAAWRKNATWFEIYGGDLVITNWSSPLIITTNIFIDGYVTNENAGPYIYSPTPIYPTNALCW